MTNPLFNTLLNRFISTLPPGADVMKKDLENGLRSALHATFDKMDLVTREEFEVQAQVLARSRAKLEQLEKSVADLESEIKR